MLSKYFFEIADNRRKYKEHLSCSYLEVAYSHITEYPVRPYKCKYMQLFTHLVGFLVF